MYRAGRYPVPAALPSLMGYEAAGTIDAVGEGVEGWKAGDKVCVLPRFRLGQYGVWGEQAIVPADPRPSDQACAGARQGVDEPGGAVHEQRCPRLAGHVLAVLGEVGEQEKRGRVEIEGEQY